MNAWGSSMVIDSGVTRSGVRYEIDDRYMAACASEEERRILEEQRKVAYGILLGKEKSA